MTLEDLKRLRGQLDVAISLVATGWLVDMSAEERAQFLKDCGPDGAIIGDFVVRHRESAHRKDSVWTYDHTPLYSHATASTDREPASPRDAEGPL